MIWVILLSLIFLYILFWEFYPGKKLRLKGKPLNLKQNLPSTIKKYKVIAHLHTQFSFDSLGKPSDIEKAKVDNDIDFVFITDHNNDNYKYFETESVFAGIELNTPDGRLLRLGNKTPVISHPNNFEFEHYRWKGDFKKGYLYELINIKDIIVWSKLKTGLKLTANILAFPLFRSFIRKWNALLPLDKWVDIYFKKASHLHIIGGLDLHVKFVYQEHTHGILIPSYKSGFKWLVNYIITDKELRTKEDVLNQLEKGRSLLVLNQNFGDVWIQEKDQIKFLGDTVKKGAYINVNFPQKKLIKILKKDNKPVLITDKKSFSYQLLENGKYHLECYEYDFKIGNFYFGFRPVAISNKIEVV